MFIITCVNNFANMSDFVEHDYTSLVVHAPNDYTFADWIKFNIHYWNKKYIEMNGRFYVETSKTLELECSHKWTFSYDNSAVEQYEITISKEEEEKGECDCHKNPSRIYCAICEYPVSDSDSDSDIEYSKDDIIALTSQLVPGTRLRVNLSGVNILSIPEDVLKLFDISNEKKWIFKGFPGNPDEVNWSYIDNTDKIGANAHFSMLLLGLFRLVASGKIILINILDIFMLLENVNFSMLHLWHLYAL